MTTQKKLEERVETLEKKVKNNDWWIGFFIGALILSFLF